MGLLVCVHEALPVNFVRRSPLPKGDASPTPAIMDPLARTPHRGRSARARWGSRDQNVDGPSTTVNSNLVRTGGHVMPVSMALTSASVHRATLEPTVRPQSLPVACYPVKMVGDVPMEEKMAVAIRVNVQDGLPEQTAKQPLFRKTSVSKCRPLVPRMPPALLVEKTSHADVTLSMLDLTARLT